jgi:hypothetical protein
LKARFVFLEFFVKVGKELKKTDLYLRQCWVLLQLRPGLINWSDIFDDLTNWFSHASDKYLQWEPEWSAISNILELPLTNAPLVILDEAQKAAQSHREYFRDSTGQQPQPILRELVVVLSQATTLVISGTGISLHNVEEAISSTVLKPDTIAKYCLLGGFDNRDKIERYVRQYVPHTVVTTRLLDRLHFWLQGRYTCITW